MKKIILINANPMKDDSFCGALAQSYMDGAMQSGAICKLVNLVDLQFDPIMRYGYKKRMEMEPDLLQVQKDIQDADHLVLIYPNWWATYPALLKGFFDRVFVPGFAFKYRDNSPMWDKLLTGKSARMIVTMDTPGWFYSLFYKNSGHHAVKFGVLEFSGFKPVKISSFSPMKSSDEKTRLKWLNEVKQLGMKQI
jgi:putative NADPH-quinone reductase